MLTGVEDAAAGPPELGSSSSASPSVSSRPPSADDSDDAMPELRLLRAVPWLGARFGGGLLASGGGDGVGDGDAAMIAIGGCSSRCLVDVECTCSAANPSAERAVGVDDALPVPFCGDAGAFHREMDGGDDAGTGAEAAPLARADGAAIGRIGICRAADTAVYARGGGTLPCFAAAPGDPTGDTAAGGDDDDVDDAVDPADPASRCVSPEMARRNGVAARNGLLLPAPFAAAAAAAEAAAAEPLRRAASSGAPAPDESDGADAATEMERVLDRAMSDSSGAGADPPVGDDVFAGGVVPARARAGIAKPPPRGAGNVDPCCVGDGMCAAPSSGDSAASDPADAGRRKLLRALFGAAGRCDGDSGGDCCGLAGMEVCDGGDAFGLPLATATAADAVILGDVPEPDPAPVRAAAIRTLATAAAAADDPGVPGADDGLPPAVPVLAA